MIPLYKTYHDKDDMRAVEKSIKCSIGWAEGPNIALFEQKLCEYLGINYAVVCNSGTSALHLAMMAYGIGPGDEVIIPSFTFIATANCVKFVNATPVFADIEERTYGLDSRDVEKRITPKTKAIIAVHYGGGACLIDELWWIAKEHKLLLIEDAAEALGAKPLGTMRHEAKVTTWGDCSTLSFCANKIISTGEGGALITDSKAIADKARLLRSHGRLSMMAEPSFGYNFRMSNMTAALGISQLKKIDKLIIMRRQIVEWYGIEPAAGHVYQLLTMRFPNRDKVKNYLADKGISSKVYFEPIQKGLPVTDKISNEVLSLPIYPGLKKREVEYILKCLKEV